MGDIVVGNMFPITSLIISLTILICVVLALLLQSLNTILVFSFLVHCGASWVSPFLLTPFLQTLVSRFVILSLSLR